MKMAAGGWDILLSMVYYLAYAWCASRFVAVQVPGEGWRRRLFGGLLFCGYGVLGIFVKSGGMPYIFYAALSHVLLLGLIMAVFGGVWEKKLLAAVVVAAMTGLVWNFCESFFCCLGLVLSCKLGGGGKVGILDVWGSRMILVMTYGTGTAVACLLAKPFETVFAGKARGWYLCLAVPLAAIVLILDLVNWAASNGIMVQDRGKYGLYENQLFSHGGICLFTGLAMGAAGFFVFGMNRIWREEKTREQYQSQVLYYQMMEEQYSQMERLRHDMKNHILALENLVQNRQWEQTGDYLREMSLAGSVEAEDQVTGSLAVDALFYHKRRQAVEQGIRWQCDARLPANLTIKDMDLCIIIGNILDNAVEACCQMQDRRRKTAEAGKVNRETEGQRDVAGMAAEQKILEEPWIQVYMGTVKKCLLVEARNSTDLTECPGPGRRQKENFTKHGLGLSNIRSAAAKYHGAVHVESEEGVFIISVLLPGAT